MATTTQLQATKIETQQSQKEVTVNAAFDVFDKAIAGRVSKAITTADVTLTDDEARNAVIELTGTLTGNRNLIVPARAKLFVIHNGTSGSYTVTVKTPSGTGVAVQQGYASLIRCDGTNVIFALGKGSGSTNYLREDGTWAAPGGGGGGDSTLKSAYGSRAAASNDGNLFLPTDGLTIERDTGSVYEPWGPIFPLTAPPVVADFAWVNQGSAAASDSKGTLSMTAPTNSGDSLRVLKKSAPSTPYTIIAAILPTLIGANYCKASLCWRESSSGKIIDFGVGFSTSFQLSATKWTNATTYSADYASATLLPLTVVFLRIADDGANRECSYSADGQNWIQIHSVGRTDFMTADEVGILLNVNNTNYTAAMTLLSWQQL